LPPSAQPPLHRPLNPLHHQVPLHRLLNPLHHQLLQRKMGAISAGISHIYTDNRLICVDSLQGGDIHDDDGEDVDHDTIRSNFELDERRILNVSNTNHLFHNYEVTTVKFN
jgi:hypothetical protein